jgi:hypothetical protein
VLETARKLETIHPNGRKSVCSNIPWQNNDGEKARVNAMNIALASAKIDSKIKHQFWMNS